MRTLLVFLFFLFSLTLSACNDTQTSQNETNTSTQHNKKDLKPSISEVKQQDSGAVSKLSKLGIEKNGTKIIIDTEKTKTFFENVGKQVAAKAEAIAKSLQKERFESNETGIVINKTKIEVDFNRTRSFLEKMEAKMQEAAKTMQEMAGKIEKELLSERNVSAR